MSSPITAPQVNNRAGLCPHGLPPAACPICSGGGMGGAKMKDSAPVTKPMRSGEWSFMKCYAAGIAMRAQEARIENAKTTFEQQIEFAKQLGKNIQNISDKIQQVMQNIQNSAPKMIQNVVQVINNVILTPMLNLIAQIPKLIERFADLQQKLGNMLLQAGEKLTALLGDLKNFIDKKIIENIKKRAKKFFLFFVSNIEDENYKNDDALAVFKSRELRKYIVKILKTNKKRNDDVYRSIESKTK